MFGGGAAKARCLDDADTLAQIKKLAGAHIRCQTFVVSIPGSETYGDSLDTFAATGGKAPRAYA